MKNNKMKKKRSKEKTPKKKTNKLLMGIVSAALLTGVAASCDKDSSRPPKPDEPTCDDWEWDDDDGVWQCDDDTSAHYGHSFYRGKYYSSKSLLHANQSFKSYKSSGSFKGRSGFGSGSRGGFGG